MKFNIIKSYAKINLSLGVTKRLKSGYHTIESLVSFINLHDEVKIKKINSKNHKIRLKPTPVEAPRPADSKMGSWILRAQETKKLERFKIFAGRPRILARPYR